jgi:hypothetical protein
MDRRHEGRLRRALATWEKARGLDDDGQRLGASFRYMRAAGKFLYCVRESPTPEIPHIYYAFSAMACEAARMFARLGEAEGGEPYFRMSLAAAHKADPTCGDPDRVASALADAGTGRVLLPALGFDEPRPLTLHMRVKAAADARIALAESLSRSGPTKPCELRKPWAIGTGRRVNYSSDLGRHMNAVLPTCVGLNPEAERHRLREEAELYYGELRRLGPKYKETGRVAADSFPDIDREFRS